MSEPVFFKRGRGLSIARIAELTGARLDASPASEGRIFEVAPIERAGPHDLTFFDPAGDDAALRTSQAGACLVSETFASRVPPAVSALVVDEPYAAFVKAAAALFPDALRPSSLFDMRGTAPTALVHAAARLEAGVTIDPAAIIGPRAEIGGGTLVGAMAIVGPEVRIGRDCVIGVGVSVTNALIGDRVVIHAGSRIGESGFGQVSGRAGAEKGPQLGRVIIQDGVEIGANATIDRGCYRDTVIGEGSQIDNQVRVAGDVMIGRHCVIVSASDEDAVVSAKTAGGGVLTFADGALIAGAAVARSPRHAHTEVGVREITR
jgi:UDP-3-O-[3-hydroxymyristoyl] glucosamine N-acyltransferase